MKITVIARSSALRDYEAIQLDHPGALRVPRDDNSVKGRAMGINLLKKLDAIAGRAGLGPRPFRSKGRLRPLVGRPSGRAHKRPASVQLASGQRPARQGETSPEVKKSLTMAIEVRPSA